jgi:cell wall-associated NlpC family hydrolase
LIQRFHIQHRARAGTAALAAAALLGSAVVASPALAGGGVSATSNHHHRTVAGAKAKLRGQTAFAPRSAPRRVKAAINAANKIAKGHAYMLGGGHEYKNGHPIWNPRALAKYQGFKTSRYDCSGTVSYVLHAAHAINAPAPSGPMEKWGKRGKGRWITVYANGGHAFMTIAGLRFDTADTPGGGPGWAKSMGYESPHSFTIRHKSGL